MALKETQEFIELIDVLANAVASAKEDGAVSWRDAPKIVPVIVALKTAVSGADQIAIELKDAYDNPQLANLLLNQLMNASLKLLDAVLK